MHLVNNYFYDRAKNLNAIWMLLEINVKNGG